MKKLLTALLSTLTVFAIAIAAQNSNSSATQNTNASRKSNANRSRMPPFRATPDQIKQAQAILKQRGFYSGEQTGKLDADTRAGLKKYQEAETLKVTGTLNKVTLDKMGIVLTDRQKAM